MINTDHQTSTKPLLCVHGTPEWWRLRADYRKALSRAASLIGEIQGDALVYGHGLERDEGFEACLAMLAEAEAAIQKARDARRCMMELGEEARRQKAAPTIVGSASDQEAATQ